MSEQPQEKRPSLGARPPTLEALVARLKPSTGDSPSSATSASPPAAAAQPGAGRLRMNILASRSNQNQTGVRPESPTPSVDRPETSGSRASSPKPASAAVASSSGDTGDAPSTTEKEPAKESQKAPKGYKNVPSLEAITERIALVRARSLSAATAERDSSLSARAREDSVSNGRDAVPVVIPEVSEPAAEPAVAEGEVASSADGSESKEEEHPLQHTWTLFHDCKPKGGGPPPPSADPIAANLQQQQGSMHAPAASTDTGAYEAGLTVVGEFNTVEGFCRYFNWLKPPSNLERNSNYHIFKDGIKPMWEDPENANGGKWVLTMKNNPQLLDKSWSWLAMALIGEELDEKDEVCGAVVSVRAKIDRIQVWTRTKDDVERINSIGRKLVKILDVANEPSVGLEFQYNTDDRPTHSKFISISQSSSYYRPTPTTPGTATAPGTPIGPAAAGATGGLSAWRTRGSRGGFGVGGGVGAFASTAKEPQSANPFSSGVGLGDKGGLAVVQGHARAHSVSDAQ